MRARRRDDKSALLHSALQSLLSETKPLMFPQKSAHVSLQRGASAHANTNGASDNGGRRVCVPSASSGDSSIGSGSDREGSHAGQSYYCHEQQRQQAGVKRQRVPTYYLRKVRTHPLRWRLLLHLTFLSIDEFSDRVRPLVCLFDCVSERNRGAKAAAPGSSGAGRGAQECEPAPGTARSTRAASSA